MRPGPGASKTNFVPFGRHPARFAVTSPA
jgi:hypothetical protein